MCIPTTSNARTTQGVKESLNKGFRIGFSTGLVMGLCVGGIGVLGISILYWYFQDTGMLFGYGFGASGIALFARVGGGIYTKSAEMGADLVGKVEAKIPEEDP